MNGRQEGFRAVAQDGEEEGGGQPVAEKGREADAWGEESLDSHEGSLGLGQYFG